MLRGTKILLVITVALWGLVSGLYNLTNWGETMEYVGYVTSMSTFEGGANGWRATSNPALIWLGALFIMLSKVTAGVMCSVGARRMWQERDADAAAFAAAKRIALAGSAVAVIMLFGGFIVVADGWFELWRSPTMSAAVLDAAFRYCGMIALIAIFVGTVDD